MQSVFDTNGTNQSAVGAYALSVLQPAQPILKKHQILVPDTIFEYLNTKYYDNGMLSSVFIAALSVDNLTKTTFGDLLNCCDLDFVRSIIGTYSTDHAMESEQFKYMFGLLSKTIVILNKDLKRIQTIGPVDKEQIYIICDDGRYSAYVSVDNVDLFTDILRKQLTSSHTTIKLGDQVIFEINMLGHNGYYYAYTDHYTEMSRINTVHKEELAKHALALDNLNSLYDFKRKKENDDYMTRVKKINQDLITKDNNLIFRALDGDINSVKTLIKKKIKLTPEQTKKINVMLVEKNQLDLIIKS